VGPLQHDSHRWGVQAPCCRPRWRTCLLEGCGRRFRPCCGRRHYCSQPCQEAARRWSQWKAQQEYRSSEKGRECRRQQSRRWRERRREQGQPLKNPPARQASAACVGHQQEAGEKDSCDRPGCYARFHPSPRSPRRRFCSAMCRKALRSARARDRRWRAYCGRCPRANQADALPEGRDEAGYVHHIAVPLHQPIFEGCGETREQGSTGSSRGRRRGTLF
jgi:hypothetical protein